MSSSTIEQKAYLQKKYLSGSVREKKKKKKVFKGKGFKLIDDDIDVSKLRPLENDELDLLGEGEDAPVVAGIIDERPEEVRKMEQFTTSSKWRVVTKDDGFNSKLQIEEIKKSIKEVEKDNEIEFGKMYSDSDEDQKNDSDASPPRKKSGSKTNEQPNTSSNQPKKNSDCEFISNRRKYQEKSPKNQSDKNIDIDHSPPRKHENKKQNVKGRKYSRWDYAEEDSNPKRKAESSHKHKRQLSEDISPPRKTQKGSGNDSDLSPPRKTKKDSFVQQTLSTDSDASPPRKSKCSPDRCRVGRDNRKNYNNEKYSKNDFTCKEKSRSDLDLSPKKSAQKRTKSPCPKRNSDSPPPSNKKMARTLQGKIAGLQDMRQLQEENETFRRLEDEAFKKLGDEVSGRNAKALSRKGQRETSEEKQILREKAARQEELNEKYKKWNKGLKQIEEHEARTAEFMHEASKPVARHRDDADLESRLRGVDRAGDPMLEYIRDKKRQQGQLPPEKPMYKGKIPPNRYNIRPGYRWDGVDRSNGYEKKYFDQQAKKRAQEEEAYKWSTEDL